MHVGVFPPYRTDFPRQNCLPHARGGVSYLSTIDTSDDMSSPCTWGCFLLGKTWVSDRVVFPMHVGVFPPVESISPLAFCLPHARGGVSLHDIRKEEREESSPCTWGCFYWYHYDANGWMVFPTHVGVFPIDCILKDHFTCLPHARGGVSKKKDLSRCTAKSSPCTWGCFRWPQSGVAF